jgi:hypothetical protein
MNWQPAQLSLPTSVRTLGESVTAVFGSDPIAANVAAAGARAARSQMDTLLGGTATYSCVHPFLHGIGEVGTRGSYLAFPNAVRVLTNKLSDANDDRRPLDAQAALALGISRATLTEFKDALNNFNQLFPTPELVMAARRADAVLYGSNNRYIIKKAPTAPAFTRLPIAALPIARTLGNTLGARLGYAEAAQAGNSSALGDLAAIQSAKASRTYSLGSAWETLKSQFSGSPCQTLYVTGSGTALKSALLAASGPDHTQLYTAMLLFVGAPDDLKLLREFFGVVA